MAVFFQTFEVCKLVIRTCVEAIITKLFRFLLIFWHKRKLEVQSTFLFFFGRS